MTSHPLRSGIHVLPTSPAGWASLVLAAVSLVSFVVFFQLVAAGAESYFLNVLGVATAIAGALVALAGVARSHERGLLVALPILWGLAWGGFLAGEFTNPH
jgi:steroid 5-alpha reductase family enzyme